MLQTQAYVRGSHGRTWHPQQTAVPLESEQGPGGLQQVWTGDRQQDKERCRREETLTLGSPWEADSAPGRQRRQENRDVVLRPPEPSSGCREREHCKPSETASLTTKGRHHCTQRYRCSDPKGHVHPNVYSKHVHNSQIWKEPRSPSADEWLRKCGLYTQWNTMHPSTEMRSSHLQPHGWN